jgi:hypothetical protein
MRWFVYALFADRRSIAIRAAALNVMSSLRPIAVCLVGWSGSFGQSMEDFDTVIFVSAFMSAAPGRLANFDDNE